MYVSASSFMGKALYSVIHCLSGRMLSIATRIISLLCTHAHGQNYSKFKHGNQGRLGNCHFSVMDNYVNACRIPVAFTCIYMHTDMLQWPTLPVGHGSNLCVCVSLNELKLNVHGYHASFSVTLASRGPVKVSGGCSCKSSVIHSAVLCWSS